MKSVVIPLKEPSAFVHNIIHIENKKKNAKDLLPFFADGYPGIMFYQNPNGVYVLPKNKKLPDFMFYGQTIHPIQLSIEGSYRLIVFQLYPSTVKSLLGINPKELNDECYDLMMLPKANTGKVIERLRKTSGVASQVKIILAFLTSLAHQKAADMDNTIRMGVNIILENRGKIVIKELREKLNISERTFERQFLDQVGVTPKQFARIIQFQLSLNKLTEKDYSHLTEIAFDNGFADQSHFIKAFKKFTGKTPKEFQKMNM